MILVVVGRRGCSRRSRKSSSNKCAECDYRCNYTIWSFLILVVVVRDVCKRRKPPYELDGTISSLFATNEQSIYPCSTNVKALLILHISLSANFPEKIGFLCNVLIVKMSMDNRIIISFWIWHIIICIVHSQRT